MLTTHDMAEADRLCHRIAIVDHGKVIALDTPRGLRRLLPGARRHRADARGAGRPGERRSPAWAAWRSTPTGEDGRWTVRLYGEVEGPAGEALAAASGAARAGRAAPDRGHARGRVRPPDRAGSCDERGTRGPARAFFALCERDLWVTVRHEPVSFLPRRCCSRSSSCSCSGACCPRSAPRGGAYGTQLLPGIMGLTLVLTALQNTALPLVIEFSFTKEIEDRLLAPLPVSAVGVAEDGRSRRCAG